MKYYLLDLGCPRETALLRYIENNLDGEIIKNVKNIKKADILILSTCAATNDSIIESMKVVRYLLSKKKRGSKLIITGCLADNLERVSWLKNEDCIYIKQDNYAIPVLNYLKNENKYTTKYKRVIESCIDRSPNGIVLQYNMVEGCINKCSFCKYNYYSRKVQSVPYDLALCYLKNRIKNGTKIITLSGENLPIYGIDLEKKQILHRFIQELTEEEGLVHLILNEVTPQNMYPELLKEIQENEKVKGVCMQLESASNHILKDMKRNYTIEEFNEYVESIQSYNKYVDTVLLNGFPGETLDDVYKTIEYVKEKKLCTNMICDYSDFELIPSHYLERLSDEEQAKHYEILVKEISKNNYEVFKHYMDHPLFNKSFVVGKEGRKTILANMYQGYGISSDFKDLKIGDEVNKRPKMILKDKYSIGDYNYMYRY